MSDAITHGTKPAVEGIRIVGRCGECGLATDRLPCPHCELEARQIAVIEKFR